MTEQALGLGDEKDTVPWVTGKGLSSGPEFLSPEKNAEEKVCSLVLMDCG